MVVKEVIRFVDQERSDIEDDFLKLSAGKVCDREDGSYSVGYEKYGAEMTFSLGQPIFDKEKHLLGYLGIGNYENLDYATRRNGIAVPVQYWMITRPTEYCKKGVQIFTYWQTFEEDTKS